MRFTRVGALTLLLAVSVLAGAATGCRGEAPESAIRETVGRWIDAWTRASGPSRDDLAGAAASRELGGELRARTEGIVGVGGEPLARALSRMYSEFVGLVLPPDRGFEIISVSRDGETAEVSVRLLYSQSAPGTAAAAGLIPFDQVVRLNVLVTEPPERVFTVTRIDGEWRITAIRSS